MAITQSYQPNFLLQALSGFAAGSGAQANQNRVIEDQARVQQGRDIGSVAMDVGTKIFDMKARQKQMLDRETLQRTGLTSDELDKLTPPGMSRLEMLQEVEKQQALKTFEANTEIQARRNGFVKRLTPQDTQQITTIMNQMNAVNSDPSISADEKLRLMQELKDERSKIQPSYVYDPQAAAPRPTPQQQFAAQTNTDEAGRVWSHTERGGWKLALDPEKEADKKEKEAKKQRLADAKEAEAYLRTTIDDPSPEQIAKEAMRIQEKREQTMMMYEIIPQQQKEQAAREQASSMAQEIFKQINPSGTAAQITAGGNVVGGPQQQMQQAGQPQQAGQAQQSPQAEGLKAVRNVTMPLFRMMEMTGGDPSKIQSKQRPAAKQLALQLFTSLESVADSLTPAQIDELRPVLIYAKKLLKNGSVPEVISVKNENGSSSSEITITVNDPKLNDGKWTVIPSLVAGKKLSQKEAIQDAIDRGLTYPGMPGSGFSFRTHVEADKFAVERSKKGGAGTQGFLGKEPK